MTDHPSSAPAPGRYTVLGLMWLTYGGFYLNKLNLAPVIPLIMADLGLTHAQIGLTSACFFATYALSQLGWGWLGDRYGPRRIITLGGLLAAGANLAFGFGTGPIHLILAQAANGLGQGAGWGPSLKLLDNWFPAGERGRMLGLYSTTISVFAMTTFGLSAWLGHSWGWSTAFFVPPAIMAGLLTLFALVVRDRPPGLDRSLRKPARTGSAAKAETASVRELLKNRGLALAALGYLVSTYITYNNLTWLPNYLVETHGLNVARAGLLAMMYPAVGLLARPLGGRISDLNLGGRRKPVILVGMGMVAVLALGLITTRSLPWALALIVGMAFFDQLISMSFFALLLDGLPRGLVSTGASLMNAVGHLGSIAAMLLSGWLVDRYHSYGPVFLVVGLLAVLGCGAVSLARE